MVLKKKKEVLIRAIALDSQKLEQLKSLADAEEQNLAAVLLQCVQLTDGVHQIHQIKKIAPLLKKLDGETVQSSVVHSCLAILAEIYFSLDSKNPLKKALASTLSSFPDNHKNAAVESLTCCLRELLLTEDKFLYRKVISSVMSCMENFNLGEKSIHHLFVEVLNFLQKALNELRMQNRSLHGNHIAQTQLMHDVLMAVKASMILVQKEQENIHNNLCKDSSSALWETMSGLLRTFTSLLTDADFLQTVRSTSGMAVVLFTSVMLEPHEKLPRLVELLFLSSVESADVPEWFVENCLRLYGQGQSDSALLFLCHGALAMLEWRNGNMGRSGEHLLLDIFRALLPLSSRLKESSMAMSLSRILTLWTTSALDILSNDLCSQSLQDCLKGTSDIITQLLEYVYSHWEHPLDGVRHQTKAIFKNLLKIHWIAVAGSKVIPDPFFLSLTKKLLDLEWHIKGKYASLACLVEYLGVDSILSVERTFPSQILGVMGEQSLAPYASDLLETMFTNHKNQLASSSCESEWHDQWHEIWVSPILLALCEGNPSRTTNIIDYCLPKLLRCRPESLNHMIRVLQTSDEIITGKENTFKKFDLLLQVRIDALGLLCENHRSTEMLSMEEMQLIKFFLPYNLNVQSPGVRQHMFGLMKKLFCRIRDSAQLQNKLDQNKHKQTKAFDGNEMSSLCTSILQHYKGFLSCTCDCLFEALIPGASFPTRISVLTLLGLMAEIFSCEQGESQSIFNMTQAINQERAQILLECFASSFEEIKALAFDLIKKIPFSLFGFQEAENFQALLRAALDLSTSTKPFDCVTASYLLNFLVHQEGFVRALHSCPNSQGVTFGFQIRENDTTTDNLEHNTIVVIRYLLDCLNCEIEEAEKSLLQAAGSSPMYGRVHCIIGALQQIPLKDLSLVAEWKPIVQELILMVYRLSSVVSPVVQSSSPEGLIPMDNDLESAANLQMILNEIQPRDTNDYFSQARLLKDDQGTESEELNEAGKPVENLSLEMKGGKRQVCSVTAQMVLVCCWRSMKEISMLLGMLCERLPLQSTAESQGALMSVEQVKEIGQYFKNQLLQSRHRGAFELSYVGFVKLIEMLSRCNDKTLQQLPRRWLIDVLEEIKSSDPASKLCATRRSAGIPFYIQALLCSEPKTSSCSLLKLTMKELIQLSMPSSKSQTDVCIISQVHGLNILRALFRDTRLSENIMPYVADGTQAAILGFTSPVWAVRNSATLLFSTLITRIFGVKKGKDEHSKKNRMTGREFFTRFPTLHPFLLKQLEVVANTVDSDSAEQKLHPSLFLLLLILGRLYPSPMDGTYTALSLAPFVPFVIRCSHSPIYRTREMAAHALVPFVMVDQVPSTVQLLLERLPKITDPCIRQNHVHGLLLQILHLLQSYFEFKHRAHSDLQQEHHDIIIGIQAKTWLGKRKNPCLVTRSAYLDILDSLCNSIGKSRNKDPVIQGLWEDIDMIIQDSELMKRDPLLPAVPGLTQYLQSISRLAVSALASSVSQTALDESTSTSDRKLDPPPLLRLLLQSESYEVHLLILETLLSWLENTSPKVTEANRIAVYLLSGMEESLKKTAMEEKHPECLCKMLKILCHLDFKILFPRRVKSGVENEKAVLNWILSVADTQSYSAEVQSAALQFASKLVIHLLQSNQENLSALIPDLRQWVQIVVKSCGDEQQTEVRLTSAETLISIASFLLANTSLFLGLTETLVLWKCVFTLLQDEEQIVRDKAVDIIRVVPVPATGLKESGIAFSKVNSSMAMDLALASLCELLQQWGQALPGVLTLIEWLLVEDDLDGLGDSENLVEDEYLFEKGEVNLWVEKLAFVRLLHQYLSMLLSVLGAASFNQPEVAQLARIACAQAHRVSRILQGLPAVPEFSRTAEFTRLRIHSERISKVLEILNKIGGDRFVTAAGLLNLV
nr:PREDICTED: thyroid adenoma-associated protein [Latimeria chalumnae]|eukprot:XP_014345311.1 PREDICTED: thyroid adenoma-associated protein [Latimeria chalumnae]